MEAIPSLFPANTNRATPPGRGEHGYYKRRTDGWIITGGCWPSAKADKDFKGFDFLPQLGTFTMSFGDNVEDSNVVDRRGVKFFPHLEPWRLIFQFSRGAELFPVEQIIAYRWHIRPPYQEVAFPQLEGLQIYDLFCPECEKGIFSSLDEQEAVDQLRIHLTSKFNDTHVYRPEDLRTLGEQYGINFFAPRRGRRAVREGNAPRDLPASAPAPDLTPSEEFRCLTCGATFGARIALEGHKRSHLKAQPAAVEPVEPEAALVGVEA